MQYQILRNKSEGMYRNQKEEFELIYFCTRLHSPRSTLMRK